MENKKGRNKRTLLSKYGNEPAIDKLADFCDLHSLLKDDHQLSLSFDSFFVDDPDSMLTAFQGQPSPEIDSLKNILPTLYELYTQLVVEAVEKNVDQVSQTDSSNRLYASLKRHPE